MIGGVVGLRRLLLLLIVPLLTSCTQPWQASGLVPPAAPSVPAPSAVASPSTEPPAPVAIEPLSACSLIGVLVTADRGMAAAGYREMVLTVRNCGTKPYQLRGRPQIVVLDEDGRPLKISVVASGHYTTAPTRLALKPGAEARAVLSWRNTVTFGGVDIGASLAVAVTAGETRQLVTLPSTLDLGTTGRLETSGWS